MAGKGYRVVAPDRYLKLRDEPGEVVVRRGGDVLARSTRAVSLIEGDRDAVLYVPLADVDPARLEPSARRYACRWKGEAVYRHVRLGDRLLEDALWGYPEAPDAVAALRERVAFERGTFTVELDGRALPGHDDGPGPGDDD